MRDPLEGDSCDGLPNNPDDLDDDGVSNDNDRCENNRRLRVPPTITDVRAVNWTATTTIPARRMTCEVHVLHPPRQRD